MACSHSLFARFCCLIGLAAGPAKKLRNRSPEASTGWPLRFPPSRLTPASAMNSEGTFRVAFCALLGVALLMRLWFTIRVRRAGERLMPDMAAIRREGWRTYVIFLLFLALIVLLARNHNWNPKLSFPLPFWLRWAGVALGLASLGLWTWTHVALGRSGPSRCNCARSTGWSLPAPTCESGIPCTRPAAAPICDTLHCG